MKRRSDYYPDTISRGARYVMQAASDWRQLVVYEARPEWRDVIELARQAAMMRAAVVIGAGL